MSKSRHYINSLEIQMRNFSDVRKSTMAEERQVMIITCVTRPKHTS